MELDMGWENLSKGQAGCVVWGALPSHLPQISFLERQQRAALSPRCHRSTGDGPTVVPSKPLPAVSRAWS